MIQQPKPPERADDALRCAFSESHTLSYLAHELRGPAGLALGALTEIDEALGAAGLVERRLAAMGRRGLLKVLHVTDLLSRASSLLEGHVALDRSSHDLTIVTRQAAEALAEMDPQAATRIDTRSTELRHDVGFDAAWLKAAVLALTWHALKHTTAPVTVSVDGPATLRIGARGAWTPGTPTTPAKNGALAFGFAASVLALHRGELSIENEADLEQAVLTLGL